MRIIKKFFKAIGIILLVIIILLLLAVAGMFIYHRVNIPKNQEFLEEKGYYHPVSVGDHSLNLLEYGGAADKHRMIALGGNGSGFPIELRRMADELTEEGAVYYLARAGYDGSDDIEQDMTVAFVVEDYRKALRTAGIEAPYVLLAHSYAGVLASYWVSKYPDEIEAMIDLDGIVPQVFTAEQLQDAEQETASAGVLTTLMKLGLGDVAPRVFFEDNPDYTEDEQHASDIMGLMTMSANAFVSDLKCTVPNTNETWNMLEPNDVPKLYINATNCYETVEELQSADVLSEYRINVLTEGFEGSDAERRVKAYELELEEIETYRTEVMQPYMEKLGNCEVVKLPGSHFIHLEKPEECAEIIKFFMSGLN